MSCPYWYLRLGEQVLRNPLSVKTKYLVNRSVDRSSRRRRIGTTPEESRRQVARQVREFELAEVPRVGGSLPGLDGGGALADLVWRQPQDFRDDLKEGQIVLRALEDLENEAERKARGASEGAGRGGRAGREAVSSNTHLHENVLQVLYVHTVVRCRQLQAHDLSLQLPDSILQRPLLGFP